MEQPLSVADAVFGGREKVVALVRDMIAALCRARGWNGAMLACKAFPATAQQAGIQPPNMAARAKLEHLTSIADKMVSGKAERLPSERVVVAFLDALSVPLQNVLSAPHALSEEDRKHWMGHLKQKGVTNAFAANGKVPQNTSLELLLALEALARLANLNRLFPLSNLIARLRPAFAFEISWDCRPLDHSYTQI